MAIGLTLLAELLFLLLILALNPSLIPKPEAEKPPVLIDIGPQGPEVHPKKPAPAASAKAKAVKVRAPTHAPPPVKLYPKLPPSFVPMSSSDMVAADISKLGSNAAGSSDTSGKSANVSGPGEGPGGAHLYYAEWYVEPTRAQISGYVTKDLTPGMWGEVACKTIAHYHVEDCRQLGESPGSGLARTMRQAAWQFLIRPPRIDGKPLIGSWVRIHYEIVEGKGDR